MEKVLSLADFKSNIKTYLIDFSILLLIYFLPAISHFLAFPIYYLDPMRIALVVTLIHTTRKNSYLIALTLPIFSFVISSHPQIFKSLLLSAELLINLSLFFLFKEKLKNVFVSLFISILISKVIYYILKFTFISLVLIDDKLFSTPIIIQLLVAIVLSTYILLIDKSAKKS
jgi:hypothetical protein